MANNKKYFWLKLKDDFFTSREIKKLRKIAGGDTYTIIYLKMQLLSIKKEGLLVYEGTEKDIVEQLSLELDEEIDNISVTLSFLQANNLIEQLSGNEFLLNKVPECIGNETDAAERMRKMRAKRNNVTPALQPVTNSYIEIEKEKEIEIEIEKKKPTKKPTKNIPPTLEEVQAYTNTRSTQIDAEYFIDYYQARNWMLGKVKMKDWKAAVRTWEKNEQERVQHNKPMSSNPFKDILKELENEQEGSRNVDGDYQNSISGLLPEPE